MRPSTNIARAARRPKMEERKTGMPPDRASHSWAVLFTVIATWVTVLPESALPFQGGKALMLVLGAALALAESFPIPSGHPAPSPRWRLRFGPGVALFLSALVISTLNSPARRIALWGNDHREMGALVWAGALVLAWIWAHQRSRWALGLALLVGSGVAVGGMLWPRVHPFPPPLAPLAPGFQTGGTLGNSAFLATALTPLIPFFLGLGLDALKAEDGGGRVALVFFLGFTWSLAGMFLSGTRAGLLGLAVAALVLGTLWLPRYWRWLWSGGGITLALAALVWAASHPGSPAWNFLHRNATLTQRLIVWRATFDLLARHPRQTILGFGADTMALFFPEVYPPVLIGYEADLQAHVFDRAHNLFLDVWLQFGILGLVGMIAMGIAWLRAWRQARQMTEHSLRLDTAFAAALALLSTWLVHFPTPTTLVLIGLLAAEATRSAAEPRPAAEFHAFPILWGFGLALVAIFALSDAQSARVFLGGLALAAALLSTLLVNSLSVLEPLLLPPTLASAALLIGAGQAGIPSILAVGIVVGMWGWYASRRNRRRWGMVLLSLVLVLPPLLGDAWVGASERALARGKAAEAIALGERAWNLFPRERTALFNARAHFLRPDRDDPERLRAALEWLDRSPLPHSADWWYVRLAILKAGRRAGLVDAVTLREALSRARAYFPGNLRWP